MAKSPEEAIGAKNASAVFIAGGTEVNRMGSDAAAAAETLISLKKCTGLNDIKVEGDKVTILNNGECLFEQYKKDLQQILDKMTYNKDVDSALSLGAYRLFKRAMRIIDCNSLFHIPDWNWLGTSNDILEYANYAFEKGKPKVLYIGGILDYHF